MNYEKIYNQIILNRLNNTITGYKEEHHIIPLCMDGIDDKSNLVYLTAKEHFICHKLLCEIHPTNDKLKYAYWMMCSIKNKYQDRNYIISSIEYSRLKNDLSKIRSKNLKGKKRDYIFTKEHKEKIKLARSKQIITEETRKKLSDATKKRHEKGTFISSTNIPQKCILEGIEFSSMSEAGRYFGVSTTTIKRKLKTGESVIKLDFKELEKKYGEKEIIKLEINGIEFNSQKEAADYFNIDKSTFQHRLKNGLNLTANNLCKKRCKINGVEFVSISEAIKQLNIPKTTLMRKLKNENEINFIYI